ncbi:hypothetical protein L1887_14385 [Cichorium endivia]|nr:hypothetical protein L1887_14385 [Cichorium endivia]
MFDKEAMRLLGTSFKELIAKNTKAGFDLNLYPDEINLLKNKMSFLHVERMKLHQQWRKRLPLFPSKTSPPPSDLKRNLDALYEAVDNAVSSSTKTRVLEKGNRFLIPKVEK